MSIEGYLEKMKDIETDLLVFFRSEKVFILLLTSKSNKKDFAINYYENIKIGENKV